MARPRETNKDESPKAKISKQSIKEAKEIFRYMRPYRWHFIVGLLFIALSSFTTMLFPVFLQKLIDSAHISAGNAAPGAGAGMFQSVIGGIVHRSNAALAHTTPSSVALGMLCLLVVQMFVSYMRVYFFTYVGEHAVADMRQDIYKRVLTMSMDFFAQRRVGELSSRITADVSQVQDAVTSVFAELLRGVLTIIIGVTFILYISPKMTLLMLSVLPVIIVIALVFSKFIRKLSREAQDQLAESGTVVQETLQGITNVKSFSNEWYEIGRYNKTISNVVDLSIRNGRFRGLFISTMLFSVFGAIVLVVWYGAGLMQQGVLSFGDLTAFVICTTFVGGSMAGFAELYAQLQKTLGATQRIRELLRETSETVDVAQTTLQSAYKLEGAVSLKNIGFSYPSRKEIEVIKDISIEAKSGQQVAIVGPSGAGKSTLVSLLLRFYAPDKGQLLFDGRDAVTIPLTQLRKQIALVPQDILLFGGTILENIAYGCPGATVDEVMAAARKANAHDFIMGFPEQYNTVVGERGVQLSGGQRQRVAIARAILKDPVILLLDEATSALDSESESLVQEALQNLMKGRTSFVIAHRLSTIRNADRIVVMEDGRVKEQGTHQELISIEEGLYKNLNKLQLIES